MQTLLTIHYIQCTKHRWLFTNWFRHIVVLIVTNEKSIHDQPHHSPISIRFRAYSPLPLYAPYAFTDPLPLRAYVGYFTDAPNALHQKKMNKEYYETLHKWWRNTMKPNWMKRDVVAEHNIGVNRNNDEMWRKMKGRVVGRKWRGWRVRGLRVWKEVGTWKE